MSRGDDQGGEFLICRATLNFWVGYPQQNEWGTLEKSGLRKLKRLVYLSGRIRGATL